MISKLLADNDKINSIESIKEALVKACVSSRPSYFKPYLMSEKVTCEPDKEGFYKFFKYMLSVSKKISEGELSLRINNVNRQNQQVQEYCFFDAVHLHPRLTIIVKVMGKARLYQYLPAEQKKVIPALTFGDGQFNTIARDYYTDKSFCRDANGDINLWKLYGLFTGCVFR